MVETKRCKRCGIEKEIISGFCESKKGSGKYYSPCKSCASKTSIVWREKNKEKRSLYNKEWYRRNLKENREKKRESSRVWKKNNPDKVKKYNKKYYAKNDRTEYTDQWRKNNPDKIKANMRRWTKNNPEKARENARKRRDKKKSIGELFTVKMENITKEAFNNRCFNCSAIEKLCADHHRPLSKENALSLSNAVLLCKSCNSSKKNKDPEEFYGEERCKQLDEKLKKIAEKNNRK